MSENVFQTQITAYSSDHYTADNFILWSINWEVISSADNMWWVTRRHAVGFRVTNMAKRYHFWQLFSVRTDTCCWLDKKAIDSAQV